MKHRQYCQSMALLLLCTTINIISISAQDVSTHQDEGVLPNLRAYKLHKHRRVASTTTTINDSPSHLCKSIIAVGAYKKIELPIQASRAAYELDGTPVALPKSFEQPTTGINAVNWIEDSGVQPLDFEPTTVQTFSFDDDSMNQQLSSEEEFVCELYNGHTVPLDATSKQISELRSFLNDGTLVSAVSSVEVESIAGGKISEDDMIAILQNDDEEEHTSFDKKVVLPSGSIRLINNSERKLEHNNHRRLNMYEGDKKVLVVRVIDKAGKSPPGDAVYTSNKFFGTSGDQMTMKSQFKACSFDKFRVTTNYGNDIDRSSMAADGVLEININIKLEDSTQAQIRSACISKIQSVLGVNNLSQQFDHVVLLVEDCYEVGSDTCGYAAYAYINHWLSLFIQSNWVYPAVQMHEIGHNLNLAHSGGLNGRTYTDHTCLMGNPLWQDNIGAMCYNPVKVFQIARGGGSWYDTKYIKAFATGVVGGSWKGKLVGVAEYDIAPQNSAISLKLETGRQNDWFIGFNRAIKANVDVQEAPDQVTIYTVQDGEGLRYSHSYLKGTMRKGDVTRITNWRKSGIDLIIKVLEIRTDVIPGYAAIEVTFGPQDTPSPTRMLTSFPTRNPTLEPTPFPSSQPSFSPTKAPVTPLPTLSPTNPKPSSTPSHSPSHGPSSAPSRLPSSSPTTPKPSKPPIDPCGNNLCEPNLGENPDTCPLDCQRFSFKTKTNNNSNNAGGIMLTLKAAGDSTSSIARTSRDPICVTSLNAIGKKDADGVQVRVYTKVGSYIGHEEDDSVWKTVYNQQITTEKHIATQLEFDQPVCITPGDAHSFYIYCKKGLLFPKGNGGNKQVPYDTDNKLMIIEGIATKKEFDQVTADSYYNGEVRYFSSGSTSPAPRDTGDGKESPSTLSPITNSPSKSPSKPVAQPRGDRPVHFITNAITDANSRGVMFTLSALQQDVHITSFDIIVKKDSNAQVMVYTRSGDYIGSEFSEVGWDLVFDDSVQAIKGELTNIGQLSRDILITTGQQQSFYIYAKKGILYEEGKSQGDTFASDSVVAIQEGIALKKEFQQEIGVSKFSGGIYYY